MKEIKSKRLIRAEERFPEMKTILQSGSSEIIEKKSRFLGEAVAVHSEEEAEAYIASVRKRYYDARHHCFAYVIAPHEGELEIRRMSDDGEPQGTAGRPMLEVLTGAGLSDALVVVTRYFGGTLLGTGGLVRAYTEAAKEAVRAAQVITVIEGILLSVRISYQVFGRLQYFLETEKLPRPEAEYSDAVTARLYLPTEELSRVKQKITEISDGRASFLEEVALKFALLDGEVLPL